MRAVGARGAIALALGALLLGACGSAAATSEAVVPAATLETIDGSDVHRITLSADAARRLGITTEPVSIETASRKRLIAAEVVDRPTGAPPQPSVWVRATIAESELDRIDGGGSAVVYPTADGQKSGSSGFAARQAGSGVGEVDDPGGARYFSVVSGSGLTVGTDVIVELSLESTDHLKMPYSAVVYDAAGRTWAYTTSEPLVYSRHAITVDYIEGDWAFLSEAPPVGTSVVTVGSGELSGFENGIGR